MLILYKNNKSFNNLTHQNSWIKKLTLFSEFIKFNSNSSLLIFLNKVYSLSYSVSSLILFKFGLPKNIKINSLNYNYFFQIFFFFDFFFINYDTLTYINSFFRVSIFRFDNYKSFRLFKGLPIHGQRTASNAKSCRSLIYHKKLISILDTFGLDFY